MLPDPILPVAYLSTSRLREKGQITVPKEYRTALALEEGAQVSFLQLGRGLVLIPEQRHFQQLCDREAHTFASHNITPHDLLSTLPDTRERIVARHYPELSVRKPQRKRSRRK
jgi:AbrB family looped-hinge helix DNA binding protein